jgi:hypothetical protein
MRSYYRLSLVSAFIAIALMSLLSACGNATGTTTTGSTHSTITTSSVKLTNSSTTSVPLKVTSVDISLSVPALGSYTCGTNITETYTATFHFPANNAGGQVAFETTTNNGRASQPASMMVSAGQTSATAVFSWSGPLSSANTVPGAGGVMVTAPNAYTSTLVSPTGACVPSAASTPFQVTSIGLTAGPEVTGHRCGSNYTATYTATFNIAPGGPGGTIVFQYTTNNGRSSSSNVSLPVSAGQTTATYVFTWTGSLPQDHTAPGTGIVMMSAPSQLISSSATPAGGCSNM